MIGESMQVACGKTMQVEASGKALIKKGEVGTIILHGVERFDGHELKSIVTIASLDPYVGAVGFKQILTDEVLILLAYNPDDGKIAPAPCNIEVYWEVYNKRKEKLLEKFINFFK